MIYVPKLTDGSDGTIAKAEAPATGKRFIFDDHRDAPRGFCLRITSAGGKAFVFQYIIGGKQRRKTIGSWPSWSLDAARKKAISMQLLVSRGIDPLGVDDDHQPTDRKPIDKIHGGASSEKIDAMIDEYNQLVDAIDLAGKRCDEILRDIRKAR